MMELLVEIRKRLGSFQLEVSFSSQSGVIAGLLGASGCGKSYTLKCIAGIETPDEGRIFLNGRTLFDSDRGINLSPQKRQVGYLFQNYALFPHMTVAQNIAAGARYLPRSLRKQAVEEQLYLFRLEKQARLRPRQLSGGQQQRVALARILIGSPAALLLDEPFSALDSTLRWELMLELAERLEAFDGPVVFVSHNQEEVRSLCRRVCILDNGRSEPCLSTEELFSAPRSLAACQMAGWRNILPARWEAEHRVVCMGQALTVDAPVPEGCRAVAIRPEQLSLVNTQGENIIPCHFVSFFNKELVLRPAAGGPPLSLPAPLSSGLSDRAQIFLHLPAGSLLPLL